jgi:predicted PurR-regulated permease PerM
VDKTWSTRFRYLIFAIIIIALVAFIGYVRVAAAPLIISALIAYILNPVVEWLMARTRMSKRLAVNTVFWVGLALLVAVPGALVPVLISEVQLLIEDLDTVLEEIQAFLSTPFIIGAWMISLEEILPDFTQMFSESIAGWTLDAFHLLETITRNLLWFLVILASTYSLLMDWDRLREWIIRLAPANFQDDARRIYEEIKIVWRGYLRGNLALMFVTGILFTILWFAIGMPGALILGVIAGLLTIIPDLGPAIAALLAVAVGFVEGPLYMPISNFWFGMVALAGYLVLINIKNIFIRPRIFGRSVHMHDGIVFIAIIAAVVVQGVLGALIVIPVLASAGVMGRYLWKRILGEEPFPEVHAPPQGESEPVSRTD